MEYPICFGFTHSVMLLFYSMPVHKSRILSKGRIYPPTTALCGFSQNWIKKPADLLSTGLFFVSILVLALSFSPNHTIHGNHDTKFFHISKFDLYGLDTSLLPLHGFSLGQGLRNCRSFQKPQYHSLSRSNLW